MVSPTLTPSPATPASVAGWLDSSVTSVLPQSAAHSVAPGTVISLGHTAVPVAQGTGTGMLGWLHALGITLGNGSHLDLYFGLVSCLLLALVAGLLLSLGQQLKTLKDDLKRTPLVGAELTQHLSSARQALLALQQAVKETSPTVDTLLTSVAKSRQELSFLLSRAESVAEKLATVPTQPLAAKAPTTAALAAYGAAQEVVNKPKEKAPPVDLTVLPESKPVAHARKDPLEDLISSINAAPVARRTDDSRSVTAAAMALEEKATSKISRRAAAGTKAKGAEEDATTTAKKRAPSQAELDLKARIAAGKKVPVVLLIIGLGLSLLAGNGHAAEEKKKEGGAAGATGTVTSTVPTTPTIALPHNERGFSQGEADILQDLEKRRVELDRREQALELREKLADLLEQRLAARTSALEQLKTQLEGMMHGLSGKDDAQLLQLSQMYAAMKPDVAAGVMDKLDNAIVHDVLLKMPVKKSGKILEVMDPVKARVISEMMAARSLLPKLAVSSTTVSKTAGK